MFLAAAHLWGFAQVAVIPSPPEDTPTMADIAASRRCHLR
jgi:hypothetical protein